jgi:hypothetical protein
MVELTDTNPGIASQGCPPPSSTLCLWRSCQQEQGEHVEALALFPLEQRREEGGPLFHSGSNVMKATHNDKIFSLRVFLFGVFLFSRPNFAERSVLHFERAKIRRTGKCSAEREVFWNGLSELDNVGPMPQVGLLNF